MIMIQEEAQEHLLAAGQEARAQENVMASHEQREVSDPEAQAGARKRVQAAIEAPGAQNPRDRVAMGK